MVLLLLVNLALFAVHIAYPQNEVRFGVASWLLMAFFIVWLAPQAARNLRDGYQTWNRSPRDRQPMRQE